MTNLLRAEGLRKYFGRKESVKEVSLEVSDGQCVGLLGPNGAGKTTTFYMIAGFLKPTDGRVFLNQIDITELSMHERARLGIVYLPQEPSVFKDMTVRQNILAALELRRLAYAERVSLCEKHLEELGLVKLMNQKAYTLSGGERRRTEIARSMAMNPKFLLLDEPFAGIDPIAVTDIKQIVSSLLSKGIGVLITDHNVRETLSITENAYIITAGRILVSGDRDTVVANEKVREVYLGKDFE